MIYIQIKYDYTQIKYDYTQIKYSYTQIKYEYIQIEHLQGSKANATILLLAVCPSVCVSAYQSIYIQ